MRSPTKLADGAGLVLLVNPNGSGWWRLRYYYGGREKMLSFGAYPQVSLKAAREQQDAAKLSLAAGRDPSYERLMEKNKQEITLEIVAREWLALQKKALSAVTFRKASWVLESLLLPYIGKRPITHISAPELLETLRRVEERGHNQVPVGARYFPWLSDRLLLIAV